MTESPYFWLGAFISILGVAIGGLFAFLVADLTWIAALKIG